jgi:AsmA family protein
MRSRRTFLVTIALGAIALLAILVLMLSVTSLNFARPWLSERVSQATERAFAIHGDLELTWQRPQEVGWRRLVPWPHLRAHDVILGNPEWASTGPEMANVPQVDFALNPLHLFRRTLSVSPLILTEPKLVLEIGEDGRNNWTFVEREDDGRWDFVLQDLTLNSGTVRLVDPARKADVSARIDTLEDGSVTWTIDGKLENDTVSGAGKAGALLSLQDRDTEYPVEAQLTIGKSEITASGTLTDPRTLSGLDLQLELSGASMAHLFPFTGLVLPATPRFSTSGRLSGSLAQENFHLRYEQFKGKVGSSDLAGTLEYVRREPRPLLRGEVVSTHLDLSDLGALLGVDSDEDRKKRGDEFEQPPDKVLPAAPFRTERWDAIDAQVQFTGKKVMREKVPIDNLFTRIALTEGVLKLAPLNFGVAAGDFTTELEINGGSDPPEARLSVSARNLKLNQLFPKVEEMQASLGVVHLNAELSGVGDSIAALAASSNGEIKAFISEGTISKLILEAVGLNIGAVVVTQLFGDHQVQLNCMASDFEVKQGVMQARVFVIDTEDALIGIDGRIDLESEELALTIHPESKGVRVLSLRAPLYVRGTFNEPDVDVDTGVVGMKAGTAIALGVFAAPLAALLALINPGPNDEESPCPGLLERAREKPTAPAPEQAAREQAR